MTKHSDNVYMNEPEMSDQIEKFFNTNYKQYQN